MHGCNPTCKSVKECRVCRGPHVFNHLACGTQAFKEFPLPLLKKLCKGMSLECVKPNTIVCEEDEPSDSMFIVLAGLCQVRAQPPPEKQDLDSDSDTLHPYTVGRKHSQRIRVTAEETVWPFRLTCPLVF